MEVSKWQQMITTWKAAGMPLNNSSSYSGESHQNAYSERVKEWVSQGMPKVTEVFKPMEEVSTRRWSIISTVFGVANLAFAGYQAGKWLWNRYHTNTPLTTTPQVTEDKKDSIEPMVGEKVLEVQEAKEPVAGENKEALELHQAYQEYMEATPETKEAKGVKLQEVWNKYQAELAKWEQRIHQQILSTSSESVDNVENNNASDSR